MDLVIGLCYFLGMIITTGVQRARIGMTLMGTLSARTVFGSLPWFLVCTVSILFWPIALIAWLAQGRRETPWELIEAPRDGALLVRRRRP
ncbi:MAG TPA: hypothetical protein VL551_25595 [Actinospica sp.]|jgi:hypothetical protein|nr:hypothetical protein [Actinospica sp.]